MTVDELKEIFISGEVKAIKVRVEGWLYGFEVDAPAHSVVEPGSFYAKHEKNENPLYGVIVEFPEGQTQSFHTDLSGTRVQYHKMGGGKLTIPIHLVEIVKEPV
jgi:hypothetical protein